ncbi:MULTISPECIES: DUF2835 domain-containing protein [Salinivibrio]|jgi:Protein of unknown function (DUF2835).|uniref:DUF2835 family protein n=1 Tax=Salinivibrio kushneri TaxID=1908198 RepID=A0AB36K3C0_9GAMM|nr:MULTISPECIES: DUF2835 domain-containing protein [Salinivibrio]ODP97104.1 hypothetical protein BGL48_01435 [Salinivibrio sp. BNH]OOE34131.1 hypothetical protein BZG04_11965 [Salinivibrio kushneri]OOE34230.1 hypothetical protein BZG05_08525 [Salinivibrio kushneri]OOE41565.1 hypothetical protein BZG00_00905 [Salinivibrio kushneri]OOE43498.1 hypothetical protein BZG09_10365 [Salinivibrio kushneri]
MEYYFNVYIAYSEYQHYYSGAAANVVVTSDQGLRLQIPASRFRPFLSHLGIRGRFKLVTDANHKFQSLMRVA